MVLACSCTCASTSRPLTVPDAVRFRLTLSPISSSSCATWSASTAVAPRSPSSRCTSGSSTEASMVAPCSFDPPPASARLRCETWQPAPPASSMPPTSCLNRHRRCTTALQPPGTATRVSRATVAVLTSVMAMRAMTAIAPTTIQTEQAAAAAAAAAAATLSRPTSPCRPPLSLALAAGVQASTARG